LNIFVYLNAEYSKIKSCVIYGSKPGSFNKVWPLERGYGMLRNGSVKKALVLLLLLVFIVSGGLGTVFVEARNSLAELSSEKEVELLILLNEQVDTEEMALEARMARDFGIDAYQEKHAVRLKVVKSLQDTATLGQSSILRFLENEKSEGRVSAIKSYFIVNLIYARVSKELVDVIANRPEVDSVWPNKQIQLVEAKPGQPVLFPNNAIESETWSLDHIGAPQVWNAYGLEGDGVVVGIIDTGVDFGHEALTTQYRGYDPSYPDKPDHTYNWYDPYYDWPYPDDYKGHGTHCAGIVLGSSPAGDNQMIDNHIGVAPGAQWIAARGLNDYGQGDAARLLSAMEYMLAPIDADGKPNPDMAPDIVNNSWSGDVDCDPILRNAIQSWRSADILPVFSAGNYGPEAGTIGMPANYEESFAVGATSMDDELPDFSSRGPGACGPFWKPDLAAPGINIFSALSENPNRPRGYVSMSGTSMAAPHVSGVAALLRSADFSLTIEELETIMKETAIELTSSSYPHSPNHGFGYGLVDAFAAVEAVAGPLPQIPVTSVRLNKSCTSLTVGETETLVATVYPLDATNKNVAWFSSNPSVATVSADGLVTAINPGTAYITVTTEDGNQSATCTVKVIFAWPEELEDMLFIGKAGIRTCYLFSDRAGAGKRIDDALTDDVYDGKAFVKLSGQPLMNILKRQEATVDDLVDLIDRLWGYWDCNGIWIGF